MTICATRKSDGYRFNKPLPDKAMVLSYMRSFSPNGYGEGFIEDLTTHEFIDDVCDNGYEYDGLFWRDRDIYNLDHHNLELNQDFLRAVRQKNNS